VTWSTLRRTIGLTELLVPFYAAVIIRQFFWLLDSNGAAWILTILISLRRPVMMNPCERGSNIKQALTLRASCDSVRSLN